MPGIKRVSHIDIQSSYPRTKKNLNQIVYTILYFCIILQRICQKHLLIIRVSQNPLILLTMCPKEWRYQWKPFISHFQRWGGEVRPLVRIMLWVSIWGSDTEDWSILQVNKSKPTSKLVDTQWTSIQYQDRSPPKSTVHPNSDFGISEHPDSIIMGMTKSPKGLKFSHAILIPSNESII